MTHTSSPYRIALALLLLCCGYRLQAQEFDMALHAGLALGQIDGDQSSHYRHPGYTAGIHTTFPLSSHNNTWRMLVEIGAVEKGALIDMGDSRRNISLHYVHVPLLLTYNATLGSNPLRVGAGIAPAIRYRAKVLDDGAPNTLLEDNYKKTDLLPFCAELYIGLYTHWGLLLRYYNSLMPIEKESGTGTYRIARSNKGVFNNTVSLSLTYHF